jgi:hypothetical protein
MVGSGSLLISRIARGETDWVANHPLPKILDMTGSMAITVISLWAGSTG